MNTCENIIDYMNTKSLLTESILNFPQGQSNIGNTIIFPALDYICTILNEIFKMDDNTSPFTLTLKGGLAVNRYLSIFKRELNLDSIDRKTIESLISKISDYDTTFTIRGGLNIPDQFPQWVETMYLLFSKVQQHINNNPTIQKTVNDLADNLQRAISTKEIVLDGYKYRALPITQLAEFAKVFPDSCRTTIKQTTKSQKIKKIDISYTNKNNLFLIFKSPKGSKYKPDLGMKFTHTVVKDDNGKLKFILDRIMGNFVLYEEYETGLFRSAISNDWTYNFEILDISVDARYESIRNESLLGTIEVESNGLKTTVLNIASIIYDSYNMFREITVSKVEKRCKRLFIFLKVYNIIKKYIYDKISKFNVPPGMDIYFEIDKYLLNNPAERRAVALKYPQYKEIQELEAIITQTGDNKTFIENIKNLCLNVSNPAILEERDKIFNVYLTKVSLFSEFIRDSILIYDLVKDKTIDRLMKVSLDPDYFSRLVLYSNINTWRFVSEQMISFYNRLTNPPNPPKIHRHGGVKFVEDVENYQIPLYNNLIVDILNRIQTFVKNRVLISYDIDTFTVEDNQTIIDAKMDFLIQQIYNVKVVVRDAYNWEIVNNLEEVGIYKSSEYLLQTKCSGKSENNCTMFYFKDDTLHKTGKMPFTVIRGNVLLKHKYCDLYFLANTIDFNAVDRLSANSYINNNTNPQMSFQLCIMILLNDDKITSNEYLYLSSLFFYRQGGKPNNRLMRAVFYAILEDSDNITDSTYPFESLDLKIYNKMQANAVPQYLQLLLQQIRLNKTEIASILRIDQKDILDEVIADKTQFNQIYSECKNTL